MSPSVLYAMLCKPLGIALVAMVVLTRPGLGAERPPNVVFILADDLGYAELGSYGQQKIRTPHIDQLARQGMRLTQHYSGNTVCAPSRCVLMTGQHPGHAYIRSNREVEPEGQYPIPEGVSTIAELLRDQGYATGAFGKWGLGGPDTPGEPLRQGFDRFFGYNCQRHAHSYYPSYLWSNDERIELGNQPPVPGHARLPANADPADPRSFDRFKGTDYAPDRIREQALQFIRDNRDRPFFLYYPTVLPHLALHVPDEELVPYLTMDWTDPPFTAPSGGGLGYTPHHTPRAAYAAMITRMDRNIGAVLELLDQLQLSEDTLVVFTSDNGTTGLTDEVDSRFFKSVGELRGLKGSLYEGGIRVPAIIRWPSQIAAGSVSDRISGFEDWLPTLLDLAGASEAIPENLDGISMAPSLRGRTQEPRPFLYREYTAGGGQQSIRVGKWKAIRSNTNRADQIELYDLETDVGEQRDVAQQRPGVVQELATLMKQQHTPSAKFPLKGIDSP